MIKITILILYFQAINWAICWDTKSPLILNKKEDKVFFPNYVDSLKDPKSNTSEIIYKNPNDQTVSTYTFCRDFPARSKGLLGQLLSVDTKRSCDSEVDNYAFTMYTRDQVKGEDKKPVTCKTGVNQNEVTGTQYKVNFKVQINEETYIQNAYNYCYDHKNLNTLYAYYDLETPSLLKNENLIEEQNYPFFLKRPNFDGPADVDILVRYEKQSDYFPNEVAISEFIPFGHWRFSFRQSNNVAPMNIVLRDSWKAFIGNIRSKLAEKTEPVKVLSGIHGKLKSQGLTVHLSRDEITIPMVWWIALFNEDKSQGIAFIMHNYTADGGYEKPKLWCNESKCNDAGLNDVVPESEEDEHDTMMYCCSAEDIAKKVELPKEIFSPTKNLLMFKKENV